MMDIWPWRDKPTLRDAIPYGGGAIMYGILLGCGWYYALIVGPDRDTMQGGKTLEYWILLNLISSVGFFIIGLFVVCQSRYAFLVLVPFSILGFASVPFGTILYIAFWMGIWRFIPLYFPFDRKQKINNESKIDDT